MRLYENEAKKVFRMMGMSCPKSYGVINSPEAPLLVEAGYPMMLKALVLIGGRGKAGGIKKVENPQEARNAAAQILGARIRGYEVNSLLVEEAVEEVAACYVGVTMDPASYNLALMVSPSGGVDIETVARERPEDILRIEIQDNAEELPQEKAQQAAEFLTSKQYADDRLIEGLALTVTQLYNLFQKYDCKTAEINPLIISKSAPSAADAKIVIDDNALFRNQELLESLGIEKKRHDVSESTSREIRALKAGFPYVDLLPEDFEKDKTKLYVGLVPGGAGYGIFSIDEVVNVGNRFFDGNAVPVNFMDSGGGPSQAAVEEMFHLLMDYDIVDLIITSRFGGISSCDVFIRGLIQCIRDRYSQGRRLVPVYGRMVGTDLPSAGAFLEKALAETPEALSEMKIIVGNRKIMAEVIKEALERGFSLKGDAV